jgi:thymidylate synthase (FAD)
MDAHAQIEIRECADIIGYNIVSEFFPLLWEAFVDYRLEAMSLSRLDQAVISRLVTGYTKSSHPFTRQQFLDCQDPQWQELKSCRERAECWAKLAKINLVALAAGEAAVT